MFPYNPDYAKQLNQCYTNSWKNLLQLIFFYIVCLSCVIDKNKSKGQQSLEKIFGHVWPVNFVAQFSVVIPRSNTWNYKNWHHTILLPSGKQCLACNITKLQ